MNKTDAKPDPIAEHTSPLGSERTDSDFLTWKAAKVRASIEQAEDREQMIPAKKIWETLGLEP